MEAHQEPSEFLHVCLVLSVCWNGIHMCRLWGDSAGPEEWSIVVRGHLEVNE